MKKICALQEQNKCLYQHTSFHHINTEIVTLYSLLECTGLIICVRRKYNVTEKAVSFSEQDCGNLQKQGHYY